MSSMDFPRQEALNSARELDSCANSLKSLVEHNMSSTFSELKTSWQGISSDAFLQKGALLCEQVSQNAQTCFDIANNIRTVAQFMEDSEEMP